MREWSNPISRRAATIGLVAGSAALAAYGALDYLPDFNFHISEKPTRISELQKYNKILINPPHPNLIKPIVNAAYAPYVSTPDQVKELVRKNRLFGSDTFRVYMNNDFWITDQDGNFNMSYLEQLKKFTSKVQEYSDNEMGVIVCFKDFYNLLYRNIENGLYRAKPLNDAALMGLANEEEIIQRQTDVFTKEEYINYYINGTQVIMNHLKDDDLPIRAWEVGNEPDRKDIIPYLPAWYKQVGPAIRAIDSETPIISGLKNPMSVDPVMLLECGVNNTSAHAYGSVDQQGLNEFIDLSIENAKAGIPMASGVLTEQGGHIKFGQIETPRFIHDARTANNINSTVLNTIRFDGNDALISYFGVGLWQTDYGPESKDGFNIDPDYYPLTRTTMQQVSALYSFN